MTVLGRLLHKEAHAHHGSTHLEIVGNTKRKLSTFSLFLCDWSYLTIRTEEFQLETEILLQ